MHLGRIKLYYDFWKYSYSVSNGIHSASWPSICQSSEHITPSVIKKASVKFCGESLQSSQLGDHSWKNDQYLFLWCHGTGSAVSEDSVS